MCLCEIRLFLRRPPSKAVFAVSRERKNALSSWRISLSWRTTQEDITGFLQAFDACYKNLPEKGATSTMSRELTPCQWIERSIHKKYRKQLWRPFTYAIKHYELIQPGDKIAVCISGGKDSMLLAQGHAACSAAQRLPFELVYLVMDLGTIPSTARRSRAMRPCWKFPSPSLKQIFSKLPTNSDTSPCYLCSSDASGASLQQGKRVGLQ